jgi:hypothetical protein
MNLENRLEAKASFATWYKLLHINRTEVEN